MTFVITSGCCNDAACIAVCPVQCIRPRPGDPDFTTAEQLYIDPATCIDCSACEPVCPVDAISADYDLDDSDEVYLDINADYFSDHPIDAEDAPSAQRRTLPVDVSSLAVAIVGAGPAACYAATELARMDGVAVTLLDRLPTPYGLIRSGVAADHQHTKRASAQFRSILAKSNVTCLFNVEVGRDVTVEELLEHHHAVVWATGAQGDNRLGIPGEDLPGCLSARELVAWYNGHPDHVDGGPDLSGERVVVIGNGNVALDVARTLAAPVDHFEHTDLAEHALEALRNSAVTEVVVAARRGPVDTAGTLSEIQSLADHGGLTLVTHADEVATDTRGLSTLARRKLQVLADAAGREPAEGTRTVTMRFGLSPLSIDGTDHVTGVSFRRHRTTTVDGVSVTEPTEEIETIPATLVLKAIGYRAIAHPGVPFDETRGALPHDSGRVLDDDGTPVAGLYCTGWVKRGATGVIGTNKIDATETVAALLEDLAASPTRDLVGTPADLAALVRRRQPDVVDHHGWINIDQAEQAAGRSSGRPRVKLVTVEELLAASAGR